jgi:F-type H+-transporting ATPase subunit c
MSFRKALMLVSLFALTFGASFAMADDGHSFSPNFAAFLGLGIAAFGGALGQGKTAAAALEGIGRNPAAADRLFVPMIIGLALIESLVIYALLIAFIKT